MASVTIEPPALVYLDTTVLLAYTLTRLVERDRYAVTAVLLEKINAGQIRAVTSFYALHEVLIFALRNVADPIKGRQLGKEALLQILQTEIGLLPMLTREEKILQARTFSRLKDPSDISHAISARLCGCTLLVSYDQHFADLPPVLCWKTPDELV